MTATGVAKVAMATPAVLTTTQAAGQNRRSSQVSSPLREPPVSGRGGHGHLATPAATGQVTAETAFRRLAARLTELDDTGTTWPCREQGELWFADDPDERAAAAEACRSCPALTECGDYATTAREKFGVWAGKDRTPRPRQGDTP